MGGAPVVHIITKCVHGNIDIIPYNCCVCQARTLGTHGRTATKNRHRYIYKITYARAEFIESRVRLNERAKKIKHGLLTASPSAELVACQPMPDNADCRHRLRRGASSAPCDGRSNQSKATGRFERRISRMKDRFQTSISPIH